jgi:voltage-gated potassium channel
MSSLKQRVYELTFDAKEGDRVGRGIFFFIMGLIVLNVILGILHTEPSVRVPINNAFGYADSLDVKEPQDDFFKLFETVSVLIFTVEYLLRIWSCTAAPEFQGRIAGRLKFAKEPLSIVDLLAIAPFYAELLLGGVLDLRFLRILRLFRLFRLFRSEKLQESFAVLTRVIKGRREELMISFIVMGVIIVLSASIMYLVEHDNVDADGNPDTYFTSTPVAMWWAIVTVTTIGYGDTYPKTPAGRTVGAFVAILGVCAFALPVGIIGAGFLEESDRSRKAKEGKEAEARTAVQILSDVTGGAVGGANAPPDVQAAGHPANCPHCGKSLADPA